MHGGTYCFTYKKIFFIFNKIIIFYFFELKKIIIILLKNKKLIYFSMSDQNKSPPHFKFPFKIKYFSLN